MQSLNLIGFELLYHTYYDQDAQESHVLRHK